MAVCFRLAETEIGLVLPSWAGGWGWGWYSTVEAGWLSAVCGPLYFGSRY